MKTDEIMAMAREAGFRTGHIDLTIGDPVPFIAPASGTSCIVEVQRFAALVAAKEREACAKVAESMAPEFGEKGWAARDRGDFTLSLGMLGVEFQLKECASAIRARVTKEGV